MTRSIRIGAAVLCSLALAGPVAAQAPGGAEQKPEPPTASAVSPCEADAGFRTLEFWVGDWDVFVGDKKVGTNRIEKILGGCALMEHWTGSEGSQGKSLFYYQKATGTWKQVWVTQDATRPGGLKEKTLVERFDDGGVRFQGSIPLANGKSYLDRTTLTPMDGGRVRQLIEISQDGGASWRAVFEAVYVPAR